MAYRRFEDLPVWKDAIDLAVQVYAMGTTGGLKVFAGLRDQLERASLSISNNIAEGFERGTTEELLTFLYIARGSAGEVRSMLILLRRLADRATPESGILNLGSAATELRPLCESISRQLGGWIESIKNSGYKGTRSRNDQVRQTEQSARRRHEYLDKLGRIQEQARRGPTSDRPEPSE